MDLRIVTDHLATGPVLHVAGEVDLTSAPQLRDRIEEALAGPTRHLRLNLARVTFMDGGGVEVLLESRRRALVCGGSLTLVTPSGAVRRVLELTGFDEAFEVIDVPAQLPRRGLPGASPPGRRYSWKHGQTGSRERAGFRVVRDGP